MAKNKSGKASGSRDQSPSGNGESQRARDNGRRTAEFVPKVEVEIASVRFQNPVLTASGTFGYGQEFARLEVATASVTVEPDSTQVLCSLSGGSTALVSLGRRFPLGDVCRVEVFGTRDAEDCRFLWPPDGEAVFLDALCRQAEAFAAWVRGAEPAGATAADAVAALAAAEQVGEPT